VGFAGVAGKVAAQIEKQARVLVDVAGAIILGSAGLSGINLARRAEANPSILTTKHGLPATSLTDYLKRFSPKDANRKLFAV
jgi:hypothetical protein